MRGLSKKYTFGMGAILGIINVLWIGSAVHSDKYVLITALASITVVCVTYITGQAKIDLQVKSDVGPS